MVDKIYQKVKATFQQTKFIQTKIYLNMQKNVIVKKETFHDFNKNFNKENTLNDSKSIVTQDSFRRRIKERANTNIGFRPIRLDTATTIQFKEGDFFNRNMYFDNLASGQEHKKFAKRASTPFRVYESLNLIGKAKMKQFDILYKNNSKKRINSAKPTFNSNRNEKKYEEIITQDNNDVKSLKMPSSIKTPKQIKPMHFQYMQTFHSKNINEKIEEPTPFKHSKSNKKTFKKYQITPLNSKEFLFKKEQKKGTLFPKFKGNSMSESNYVKIIKTDIYEKSLETENKIKFIEINHFYENFSDERKIQNKLSEKFNKIYSSKNNSKNVTESLMLNKLNNEEIKESIRLETERSKEN